MGVIPSLIFNLFQGGLILNYSYILESNNKAEGLMFKTAKDCINNFDFIVDMIKESSNDITAFITFSDMDSHMKLLIKKIANLMLESKDRGWNVSMTLYNRIDCDSILTLDDLNTICQYAYNEFAIKVHDPKFDIDKNIKDEIFKAYAINDFKFKFKINEVNEEFKVVDIYLDTKHDTNWRILTPNVETLEYHKIRGNKNENKVHETDR